MTYVQKKRTKYIMDELIKQFQTLFESNYIFIVIIISLILVCCLLVAKVVKKIIEIVQIGRTRKRFYNSLLNKAGSDSEGKKK